MLDFFFDCLNMLFQYTTSYTTTLDIDWDTLKQTVRQRADRSLEVVDVDERDRIGEEELCELSLSQETVLEGEEGGEVGSSIEGTIGFKST